jgi:hypothetical protein
MRLIIAMFMCTLMFGMRSFLFMANPLFQLTFEGLAWQVLYPWFFYPVPEVLPALVVLYLMWPKAGAAGAAGAAKGEPAPDGFMSLNGARKGGTESDALLSGEDVDEFTAFNEFGGYGGYGDEQTAASSGGGGGDVEGVGAAGGGSAAAKRRGGGVGGGDPSLVDSSLVKRGPLAGTIWV